MGRLQQRVMRALLTAPAAPGRVELREVPDPVPNPHQALVRVLAVSLNAGEVRRLADRPLGELAGWDLAGVVEAAAENGGGPEPGERVVGLSDGAAWAELAAVDVDLLAPVPSAVSEAQAASLPVAGLTALKSIDIIGQLLARPVLVTGASGGVGRFAIQLAHLAGAHVTAVAPNPQRRAALLQLGAEQALTELAPDGPSFHGVVDAVGGPTLGLALQRVAPRGVVVSFASTDPAPVEFPTRAFFARAPGAVLKGLFLFDELARERSGSRDLARLVELVERGRLDCSIARESSWREAPEVIAAFLDRQISGKAILHLE